MLKRALKPYGHFYLNMGDTYSQSHGHFDAKNPKARPQGWIPVKAEGLPPKCLCGIPGRLANAMVDKQGWVLRNSAIWNKPNAMPSSVKDRLANTYEFIFIFARDTKTLFWHNEKTGQITAKKPATPKDGIEGVDWEWREVGIDDENTFNVRVRDSHLDKFSQKATPSEIALKYGYDPEGICPVCGRTWKRHASPNAKDRAEGIKREFIPCKTRETKIPEESAEMFGSPRARYHRKSKRKKVSFWHGHDCWYDLDAIREPHKESTISRAMYPSTSFNPNTGTAMRMTSPLKTGIDSKMIDLNPAGKNPGDVFFDPGDFWTISTQPCPESHFACVDSETEILTINGWKKWNEVKRGNLIASYDIENQVIDFVPCSYIKSYNVDMELIKVGGRDLDILMTPNHRNIALKKSGKEKIIRADELISNDKIRVSAKFRHDNIDGSSIGEHMAELIGWVITEGHFNKVGNISIYQNEGENANNIRRLLKPFGYSERIRRGNQVEWYLYTYTSKMIKAIIPNKKLTRELVFLPMNEASKLFKSLIAGDGCERKDDGRLMYTQKDKESIDWFSVMAMRMGYSVIISKGKDRSIYKAYLTKRSHIGIRKTNGKGINIRRVRYKGIVWCPTTKYGTWIARRNGRIFITGNTFPEAICKPPILSSCPLEICKKCGLPRVRVTKPSEEYAKNLGTWTEDTDKSRKLREKIGFKAHTKKASLTANYETIGWTDCGCGEEYEAGIALDPFCGTGTLCAVAKRLGRRYIGIDISPQYCKMAETKLAKTHYQMDMFD